MPNELQSPVRSLLSKPHDDEIDVYGLTHTGNVRPTNQDHFLICSLRKKMDVFLTSLPGIEELDQIARDAVVISTADAFHHGIGYGDPPEDSLYPEEGGLDLARTHLSAALEEDEHCHSPERPKPSSSKATGRTTRTRVPPKSRSRS